MHDESTRRAAGQRLLELELRLGRFPGRVLALLARRLDVTERTLRNWLEAARTGTSGRRGRPAHAAEVFAATHRRVARVWKDLGRSSGEAAVHAALEGLVPLRVVRVHLRRMKARLRRRRRACRERDRVTAVVQARDVIWSLDATHLGRDAGGEVQAEALRDAASASALSVSVGRPSSGAEVVALLERTAEERGGAPLALAVDCGSNYASGEVGAWAVANTVVVLQSLPRVPQHNAWVERGHRELKEDSELGKGTVLEAMPCRRWTIVEGQQDVVEGWYASTEASDLDPEAGASGNKAVSRSDLPRWCQRLAHSVTVLNKCRPRASRGGWTARELDAALPRGDDLVGREGFHRTVCRNVEIAVLAAPNARARRRARRDAILCTLETYGLVRRTRGGRPWSQPISETQA